MKHANIVVFDVGTTTDAGDHDGTGFPKPPHHVPITIALLRTTLNPHHQHSAIARAGSLSCGVAARRSTASASS